MVDRLCTSLGGLSLSAIRRYTALAAEREGCIVLTSVSRIFHARTHM